MLLGRIDWNVMVKKHALLMGLAIRTEVSVPLLASGAHFAVAPTRAGIRDRLRKCASEAARVRPAALLVPSSFPVGGYRGEQRDVIGVAATRENPEQESVDEAACASARVLDMPRRQP